MFPGVYFLQKMLYNKLTSILKNKEEIEDEYFRTFRAKGRF